MCRLFAYLGHERVLLADTLILPEHAITKQIHEHYLPGLIEQSALMRAEDDLEAINKEADLRNKLFSVDGFGVAFYTKTLKKYEQSTDGPLPVLYKSIAPVLTDPCFQSFCNNLDATCIMAHVRATTNGAVVPTNNHPFVFGRHAIAHNGEVANIDIVRRGMCDKMSLDYHSAIRGTTDSEHMAALYMTHLGDQNKQYPVEAMKTALLKMLRDVHALQDELVPKDKKEASSINIVASDGEQLVAIRWRNSATEHPPSLYLSTTAGVALNRKFPDPDSQPSAGVREAVQEGTAKNELEQPGQSKEGHEPHVVVASEPTTFDKDMWLLIDKNHVVTVDKSMHIKIEPIEL